MRPPIREHRGLPLPRHCAKRSSRAGAGMSPIGQNLPAAPYCVSPFLLPSPKNPCSTRAKKASQAGRRRFDPGRPLLIGFAPSCLTKHGTPAARDDRLARAFRPARAASPVTAPGRPQSAGYRRASSRRWKSSAPWNSQPSDDARRPHRLFPTPATPMTTTSGRTSGHPPPGR